MLDDIKVNMVSIFCNKDNHKLRLGIGRLYINNRGDAKMGQCMLLNMKYKITSIQISMVSFYVPFDTL